MKRSDLTLLLLFLFFAPLSAGEVTLTLKGKGYAGALYTVHLLKDPITQAEFPLGKGYFNSTGEVTIRTNVNENSTLYIRSGAFRFILLVIPDYSCTAILPDYISRPDKEMDNPFYEEVAFIPEIANNPSDRNNLIRDFDREYNNAYNAVAYRVFNNFRRDQLPAVIEKLNTVSTSSSDKWFSDFVNYRMIMLNVIAKGETHGRIEDSVIINRNFDPYNPACTDLVNQVYSGLFGILATGKARMDYNNALTNLSVQGVRELIARYASVSLPELSDYILMLNLHSAYWSGSIPKDLVLAWLVRLSEQGANSYIKKLAGEILPRLEICMPGTAFPFPALYDNKGKIPASEVFKGKPSLIAFVNPADPMCDEELMFLSKWAETYSAGINLVFVLLNTDFNVNAVKIAGMFPWATILNGGSDGIVKYNYGLKTLPVFMITDRENRLYSCQTPMPSENLEAVLKTLLRTGN